MKLKCAQSWHERVNIMEKRDTTTYELERRGQVEHRGITTDTDRRETDHQQQFPGSRLVPIGPRKTRTAALRWERKQSKTVTPKRGAKRGGEKR
jgi:hypothetical protein